MSVAWHPGGGCLVAGTSQGTLHAWDIAASRELLRITVGTPHQENLMVVMSVAKSYARWWQRAQAQNGSEPCWWRI